MTLSIQQLEVLVAVMEAGTLTGAAERLHVTQPAISYQIKQAEQRIGTSLFERLPGQLRPTHAAHRFERSARLVLRELESAERDVRRHLSGQEGVLRLSTVCSTAYHWLPGVLEEFGAEYPGVELLIDTTEGRSPIEALERGDLDVVLTTDAIQLSSIRATPLFRDEVVAIVAPEHELASHKHLVAKDFASETVLVWNEARSDLLRSLLAPAGVRPRRVVEVQATDAMVAMVRVGLGVGALASWIVAPQISAGEVVQLRLSRGGLRRRWVAATSNGSAPRPVRDFVRILKARTRELPR